MEQNLKFFKLLASSSEKDVLGFGKHLKHAHGNEENSLLVFNYYKRFYLGKEHLHKVDMADAHLKIFGQEMAPNMAGRKKMLNAFSDLHLWLKDFLISEKLQSDPFIVELLWLSILLEKGLSSEFSRQATRLYESEQETVLDSTESCLRQIAIGQLYKQYLVSSKPSPDLEELAECVASVKNNTDLISLKMQCELLTAQKVRPPKEKRKPKATSLQPCMLIYQEVLALLETEQEAHYFQIESLLTKYAKAIHADEKVVIIRYLHNYAAKRVRLGEDKEWGKKVHDMDKVLLKKGDFTPHGEMSPTSFNNIINAACAAGDTAWATAFIEAYKQFLPEKIREESTLLALAIVNFELKNFREVLQLKDKPEFRDLPHVIRSKTLQLRALYELNEDPEDLCASFEIYLSRHREPKSDFIEAVLAFVKVFKLLSLRLVAKSELIKALEAHPNIYFHSWLNEKIKLYKPLN